MITDVTIVGIISEKQKNPANLFDEKTFLATNELTKRLFQQGDEYLLNLPRKLYKSSLSDKLHRLLTNFDFLANKIAKRQNVQEILEDYDLALQLISDIDGLQLIQAAIKLAAHILADDPSQFPEQLLSRLLTYENECTDIQKLLARAKTYKLNSWLQPLRASLSQPRNPLLRTITGNHGNLTNVAITPDGKQFVSADKIKLQVWDLESGQKLFDLTEHKNEVTDLKITPDGKTVIAALRNGEIKVWDLENSEEEPFTLSEHSSAVLALAITPDVYLISASTDATLKLWNLQKRKVIKVIKGDESSFSGIAVLPGGKRIISTSGCIFSSPTEDYFPKIWDLEQERKLCTFRNERYEWPSEAVVVTLDGHYAITTANENLKVWDVETQTELFTLRGHTSRIHSVATLNNNWIISASSDNTLKVWDIEHGEELITLKSHHGPVSDVAITPDCQRAVSVSWDQTIKIWDLEQIKKKITLLEHKDAITKIVITPDGRWAISASKDHNMIVWDIEGQAPLWRLQGHTHWITDVTVTNDSRHAISASWDGTLKVWEIETGKLLQTLSDTNKNIEAVVVTPDGRFAISVAKDKLIKVWDIELEIELFTLVGHDQTVNALTITSDGKFVISASDDHTLKVWDIQNRLLFCTLKDHSESKPSSLTEVSDYNLQEYLRIQSEGGERKNAIAVTLDNKRVISGSQNGKLKVWDIQKDEEVPIVLDDYSSGITSVAVTSNGRFVIATSGLPYLSSDNTLRIWDLEKQQVIARFIGEFPMNACAVAPDGVTILAGDVSGQVHFFRLEAGAK